MSAKTFVVAVCTFWMAFVLVCANSDEYNVKQSGSSMTCSVFDFEQKLLEKLVRLEMKMEFVEQKVTNLENKYAATVDRAVERLENVTHELEDKLFTIMKLEFNQSHNTLTRISDDVINHSALVTKRIEEVEKEVALTKQTVQTTLQLNQQLNQKKIAFKARHPAKDTNIKGIILIYSAVLINEGNGYDSNTGIFTAPTAGLYLFTAQMCVESGYYVKLQITVSGEAVGWLRLLNDSNEDKICVSGDGIALMSKGDKAYVECVDVSSSGDALYIDQFGNSFTGMLIN